MSSGSKVDEGSDGDFVKKGKRKGESFESIISSLRFLICRKFIKERDKDYYSRKYILHQQSLKFNFQLNFPELIFQSVVPRQLAQSSLTRSRRNRIQGTEPRRHDVSLVE